MNEIIELYKDIDGLIVKMLMEYYEEKPSAKFIDTRPVNLIGEVEWRLKRIKTLCDELGLKPGENQSESGLQ